MINENKPWENRDWEERDDWKPQTHYCPHCGGRFTDTLLDQTKSFDVHMQLVHKDLGDQ